MIERLEKILQRYNFLTNQLASLEVLNNIKLLTDYSKEQSSLEEVVTKFKEYKSVLVNIEEDKELLKDSELALIAKDELVLLEDKKEVILKELEILLLPKDNNDNKNVIVEIRGAAGGDEANIFAGDLYEMYVRYAANMGFKVEVLDEMPGSMGGYSQIEFLIKGENVYSKLKYESGSHRVQRVPATESQGRVHTSTATVAVMPEAEDVDVELNEADVRVDVYRSSGAGGQHVNTTDSAVRLTHIPTGIVVTCQNERSQIKNKEKAFKTLKTKIFEEKRRKEEEANASLRKSKVGSGDRSEKIRTYNYPQNRITDHRIGLTLMYLDKIMLGDLNEIIEALTNEDLKRKLEEQ